MTEGIVTWKTLFAISMGNLWMYNKARGD